MSKELYFMNAGLFDVRAMLTFGVSVKEKNDAIGYFGTGFKYAVAIILRLGGKISVEVAGTTHIFSARREIIRGEEFDMVYFDDTCANFTTRLGINWQPWQALRELYCNCKDESGEMGYIKTPWDTVVVVNCEEITRAYDNRKLYFVEGEHFELGAFAKVYDKPSTMMFYRGVAVHSHSNPALFTYEILSALSLTEDRTAKSTYELDYPIKHAIQKTDNADFCRKVLTAPEGTFEHDIVFDVDWGASETFLTTVEQLISQGIDVRGSAKKVLKSVSEKRGEFPEYYLSEVELKMYRRAVEYLHLIDIDVEVFPIKFVQGLGELTLGRAINGTIYIGELALRQGSKILCGTLLEEWIHCKHGCRDFDRAMQNWLIDKIITLGEELVGEPV